MYNLKPPPPARAPNETFSPWDKAPAATHTRARAMHASATTRTTTRAVTPAARPNARRSSRAVATMRAAAPEGVTHHLDEDESVSIRRRPPNGPSKHELGVGQFEFVIEEVNREGERVENAENKPKNILEEIVWYKDVELRERKEKFPLELVLSLIHI